MQETYVIMKECLSNFSNCLSDKKKTYERNKNHDEKIFIADMEVEHMHVLGLNWIFVICPT